MDPNIRVLAEVPAELAFVLSPEALTFVGNLLAHIAERHGRSVTEVPVQLRSVGGSTVNVVRDGLRLLRDVRQIRRWSHAGAYERTQGPVAAPH